MILFKREEDLLNHLQVLRNSGKTIGFVPTMGALHEGHLSLIQRSLTETGITLCSIFINPTQFNDKKDFQKYPVSIEQDVLLLESAGATILFLPSVDTIYPNGTDKLASYDLGHLEVVLEGQYRPGHFQGVCQVMQRLLELVNPDHLYMGAKDYQQCMVVKRLLNIMGSKTVLHACPTLREPNGLAMSSRNMRLNETERKKAVIISQTLLLIKEQLRPGPLNELKRSAKSLLEQNNLKVDYVEIADAKSLNIVQNWDGAMPLVALIAAFAGDVRLIDNMELS